MHPNGTHEKHAKSNLPTARQIRRTCSIELYRVMKRLKIWLPKDKIEQAEKLYFKKVAFNIVWIVENQSNRKAQAAWWEEHVSSELAELWGISQEQLCKAFRESYLGGQA